MTTEISEKDAILEELYYADERPPIRLTGHDGNAFAILGTCSKAARRFGWSAEQWDAVKAEMISGDYDNLLQTAMKYFDVE